MTSRFDPSLLALVAALLIGAATRLIGLTTGSIHVDEAHTFLVASSAWPAMLDVLATTDYHPPLFYALTHALLGLGWHETTYRYLTAPFALATIAATWAIARRLFGPLAAGVAALVVALDPTAIMWDRIYRMYVVLDALVAVSWWLLLAAETATGRRRVWLWIAFGACAIVQPYVHYLGALDVACQTLYALAALRSRWPAVASAALAALAFLWWLPEALKQLPGGGLVAGTASLPVQWWTIARDAVLEGTPLAWIQAPGFDVVLSLAVAILCVWAAWTARRSVLPFWLLVAVVQVVASAVSGKFLAAPRYLLPVLPVFAMGVGLLVDRHLLLPKVRLAGLAAGAAVLALLAYCATNVLFDPRYQFPDWNIVRTTFYEKAAQDDAVIFDQGYPAEVFTGDPIFGMHDIAAPSSSAQLLPALAWIHEHAADRIWYVENEFYYVDPGRRIVATLQSTRPLVAQWLEPRVELSDRVYVVLFGPERPARKAGPSR